DGLPNQGAFAFLSPGERSCGHFHRLILQKLSGLLIGLQQRMDFVLERVVARTGAPQKLVAVFGRAVQHRLQNVIDLFPSFGVHEWSVRDTARPWPPSSRASR